MAPDILHRIALTLIPHVGIATAKKLVAHCGGAKEIFETPPRILRSISGLPDRVVDSLLNNRDAFIHAENELEFMLKKSVDGVFFTDENYPKALRHCDDGPMLLYKLGNGNLLNERMLAIVGTRQASEYGRETTERIISELAPYKPTIVSGLAYGIDICAHKAALENNLETIGVMATGLDRIYPPQHRATAAKMVDQGCLLTEYMNGTNPDRENFPTRNRIVAGMSVATIVIETLTKGGSVITANIANSYNRDVFALPGRINDQFSEGCLFLIKTNRAAVFQSGADIADALGWTLEGKAPQAIQRSLFVDLEPEEQLLANALQELPTATIDEICAKAQFPMSKTSALLLEMEFKGVVKALPGKRFVLL